MIIKRFRGICRSWRRQRDSVGASRLRINQHHKRMDFLRAELSIGPRLVAGGGGARPARCMYVVLLPGLMSGLRFRCMLHSPPPTSSHLGNLISLFPYTVICVMAVWERMTASALGSWWGGGPPPARCMYVVLLPD